MDEGEDVGLRVVAEHDAHVAHTLTRAGRGEEHQVAGLHLLTLDGHVDGILLARRGTYPHIVLVLVHIAGETRAVEGAGTLAAVDVALADVRLGLVDDVLGHQFIIFEQLAALVI